MARPKNIQIPTGLSGTTSGAPSGIAVFGSGRLIAFDLYETTGAAGALVIFYDGDTNSGQIMSPVTLAANESVRESFNHPFKPFEQNLYVNIVNGSVKGVCWVLPDDQGQLEPIPVVIAATVPLAQVLGGQ